MRIDFTKMHGAGNDFVVIDARAKALHLSEDQARHIADRHLGIGCDQILVLDQAQHKNAEFAYRIFNANGDQVQQCGNGARALARFARPEAKPGETLVMQSPAGLVEAQFGARGVVSVNMGAPDFAPESLPFVQDGRSNIYTRNVAGKYVSFGAVSMGNPHVVILVDDVAAADVQGIGQALQRHRDFPASVNVGFAQILSPTQIALRVYERGVGETLACGTGACAAVAVGVLQERLKTNVNVRLPGGDLVVNCGQPGQPIWLSGPAHRAFEGHIIL